MESWRIKAAIIEGFLFLPKLMQKRIDMFSREGEKQEMYLPFIAFTFTCANNLRSFHVSADVLFDMMILCLRAYQLDEFVEHVIGKHFGDSTDLVKALIRKIFEGRGEEEAEDEPEGELDRKDRTTSTSIRETIKAFKDSILLHPGVTASSEYDRTLLKNELQEYLLSTHHSTRGQQSVLQG